MIEKKTLSYWDWIEVTNEVERLSGKKTDNWAGKTWEKPDPTSYQNFWHEISNYLDISNGCHVSLNFEDAMEYFDEKPWVVEILKLYKSVVNDEDEPSFYIWW